MICVCPYSYDHDTCPHKRKGMCKIEGGKSPCRTENHFSIDEIVEQFTKRVLLTGVSLPTQ